MNVEVVQRRLWKQSQQPRKHMHQQQWIATVCDRVLKRSNNQGSLESRMLGNLHVRFGVGAGVRLPGPHHRTKQICFAASLQFPLNLVRDSEKCAPTQFHELALADATAGSLSGSEKLR